LILVGPAHLPSMVAVLLEAFPVAVGSGVVLRRLRRVPGNAERGDGPGRRRRRPRP
jgi:hypothetical protein